MVICKKFDSRYLRMINCPLREGSSTESKQRSSVICRCVCNTRRSCSQAKSTMKTKKSSLPDLERLHEEREHKHALRTTIILVLEQGKNTQNTQIRSSSAARRSLHLNSASSYSTLRRKEALAPQLSPHGWRKETNPPRG